MGLRAKELLSEVIDQKFPNDGEYTRRFEAEIAKISGSQYAVAVTSCTAALFLGLRACGIGLGDEVLVPDLTFIATANAVSLAGAKAVLVDIEEKTLGIDPSRIEGAITERTKAIIPVHLSGRCALMDELLEIAEKYNLWVIEDAAEALGSKVNGKPLGSLGDIGCFSFTANKTITTGQGGVLVMDDPELYARARALKDHGRPNRGTGGADQHLALGYNFKFTNIQAALGLAQIDDLNARLIHSKHLFNLYKEYLGSDLPLKLIGFDLESGERPQWIDALTAERDELHDFLLKNGVETRKFWFPLHTQKPYRDFKNQFPVSDRISQQGIWLPTNMALENQEVRHVCSLILDWAQKSAVQKM